MFLMVGFQYSEKGGSRACPADSISNYLNNLMERLNDSKVDHEIVNKRLRLVMHEVFDSIVHVHFEIIPASIDVLLVRFVVVLLF